jgi:hypothetical protein
VAPVQSRHYCCYNKPVRIADIVAETRTQHLPPTSLECHRYATRIDVTALNFSEHSASKLLVFNIWHTRLASRTVNILWHIDPMLSSDCKLRPLLGNAHARENTRTVFSMWSAGRPLLCNDMAKTPLQLWRDCVFCVARAKWSLEFIGPSKS